MENKQKVWEKVLEIIEENTTPISFETWFKPLRIKKIDNDLNIAYIEVNSDKGNELLITIIKNRYLPILQDAFKAVLGEDYRVVLKSSEEYSKEAAREAVSSPPEEPELPKINPQKTQDIILIISLSETAINMPMQQHLL